MDNFAYYTNQLKEIDKQEGEYWDKRMGLMQEGKHDQVAYIDDIVLKRLERQYNQILEKQIESLNNQEEQPVTPFGSIELSRFSPISLSRLLEREYPDTEWIVEKLVPKEGIIALSGAPGVYKTWLVYHIGLTVATGASVFDHFQTSKGKVLVVDEESHPRLIQKRLQKLGASNEEIEVLIQQGIKLDQQTDREALLDMIKERGIILVIFDSLVRMHTKDENDAMAMARVAEALKEFTKRGITVIFTHHHRKQSIFGSKNPSQSMRGSSEILALVDCHIAVDKQDEYLLLTQTKLRQEEETKPFKIRVSDEGQKTFLRYLGEQNEEEKQIEEAQTKIMVYIGENGETTRQGLIDVLKGQIGQKTIGEALKALKEAQKITERTGERNRKYYSTPDDQSEKIVESSLAVL